MLSTISLLLSTLTLTFCGKHEGHMLYRHGSCNDFIGAQVVLEYCDRVFNGTVRCDLNVEERQMFHVFSKRCCEDVDSCNLQMLDHYCCLDPGTCGILECASPWSDADGELDERVEIALSNMHTLNGRHYMLRTLAKLPIKINLHFKLLQNAVTRGLMRSTNRFFTENATIDDNGEYYRGRHAAEHFFSRHPTRLQYTLLRKSVTISKTHNEDEYIIDGSTCAANMKHCYQTQIVYSYDKTRGRSLVHRITFRSSETGFKTMF